MNTYKNTINIDKILDRLEDKLIVELDEVYKKVFVYSNENNCYLFDRSYFSYFEVCKYIVNNFAHLVLSDNEKFADRYKESEYEEQVRMHEAIEQQELAEDKRLEAEAQR